MNYLNMMSTGSRTSLRAAFMNTSNMYIECISKEAFDIDYLCRLQGLSLVLNAGLDRFKSKREESVTPSKRYPSVV